ncbi:MAG TPA: type II toxin-antitoxin system VapC family toxin [Mucilaginibacter sp.]
MENKLILADTSILIEYFRKSQKSNSTFVKLFGQGYDFCISAITAYEIYSGANLSQLDFWNEILKNIKVIPFDALAVDTAVQINQALKIKRKQIELQIYLSQQPPYQTTYLSQRQIKGTLTE